MRTALILEESSFVARPVADSLREGGWSVLLATTASQALTMRRLFAIDLLVADVALQGSSGPDAVKQIVASRPGLEVLYISEYSRPQLQEYLPASGRYAFLQTPFSSDNLLGVAESLVPDRMQRFAVSA